MSFKLERFADDQALAEGVAAMWIAILSKRSSPQLPYTVALSGGRIAKTLFSETAKLVKQNPGDPLGQKLLENVHFFWGDERCVPPSSGDSNFAEARDTLLAPLKIPDAQIHRLRGEGPEPDALSQAINEICGIAPVINGQPVIDLIFLGMGEDGHVASLFPGEPESVISNPAVYRAVTAVKPPPRRFTLGYAAIFAAKEVWVVAAGAGKEGALKASLAPHGKTPLARVLNQRAQTRVFTDIEAR